MFKMETNVRHINHDNSNNFKCSNCFGAAKMKDTADFIACFMRFAKCGKKPFRSRFIFITSQLILFNVAGMHVHSAIIQRRNDEEKDIYQHRDTNTVRAPFRAAIEYGGIKNSSNGNDIIQFIGTAFSN